MIEIKKDVSAREIRFFGLLWLVFLGGLGALAIWKPGGLIGAALGVAACVFLASLDVPDLIPVPILQLEIVLLAMGVMSVVGVAAGVVPAWRAARVDPAVTLRME